MTAVRMHNAVNPSRSEVMAVLTIRNVPDEVYGRLRAQAEASRRSINSEAIECLRFALAPRIDRDVNTLVLRARAVHERMRGPYLTNAQITEAKRRGRA